MQRGASQRMERWTSAAIDFHGKRATCSFCIEQRSPFRTRTRKRCDRWSPQSLSNSSSMTATSHTHTHTLAIDWLFRFSLAQIGSDLNGLGGSGGGGANGETIQRRFCRLKFRGLLFIFGIDIRDGWKMDIVGRISCVPTTKG